MGYLVLLVLLVLPAFVTAAIAWLSARRELYAFTVIAMIPPVWAGVAFVRLLNGVDVSGLNVFGPIGLATVQVAVLWVVWYSHDPKGAGLALAAAEGASAVYLVKSDHPVLGAATGLGAIAQAGSSLASGTPSSTPVTSFTPPWRFGDPPAGVVDTPRAEPTAVSGGSLEECAIPIDELERLAALHARGDLTDIEFTKLKSDLLSD